MLAGKTTTSGRPDATVVAVVTVPTAGSDDGVWLPSPESRETRLNTLEPTSPSDWVESSSSSLSS